MPRRGCLGARPRRCRDLRRTRLYTNIVACKCICVQLRLYANGQPNDGRHPDRSRNRGDGAARARRRSRPLVRRRPPARGSPHLALGLSRAVRAHAGAEPGRRPRRVPVPLRRRARVDRGRVGIERGLGGEDLPSRRSAGRTLGLLGTDHGAIGSRRLPALRATRLGPSAPTVRLLRRGPDGSGVFARRSYPNVRGFWRHPAISPAGPGRPAPGREHRPSPAGSER